MPRVPRTHALPEQGVFHIVTRGAGDIAVYRDDPDRLRFLSLLHSVADRFAWRMDAFCLMTTHYHLVAWAGREALSAGLHRLNGLYASGYNRRHGRRGHLFGDRFWAASIESDRRLLAACRYVMLNPVRAGLCAAADDWRWSGTRYDVFG